MFQEEVIASAFEREFTPHPKSAHDEKIMKLIRETKFSPFKPSVLCLIKVFAIIRLNFAPH